MAYNFSNLVSGTLISLPTLLGQAYSESGSFQYDDTLAAIMLSCAFGFIAGLFPKKESR